MGLSLLIYVDTSIKNDEILTFKDTNIPEYQQNLLTGTVEFENVIYSVPADYSGKLDNSPRLIRRDGVDTIDFWKEAFKLSSSESIVKVYADAPFVDTAIVEDMVHHHREYGAEYTYSWNVPAGFGCEIYSRELIDSVPPSYDRDASFSSIIQANINQFDVELYFQDPDIRKLRLDFRVSDPRERRIMENMADIHGSTPPYADIENLVQENPKVLRVGPSYLELELNGTCELDCIFCYRNTLGHEHGAMTAGILDSVIDGIHGFGLPCTICLGGSGEPLMHENFYTMLKKISDEPLVSRVVIETNGIYANANYATALAAVKDMEIITIVNMNGMDAETYKSIHGSDHFQAVHDNIVRLRDTLENTSHQLFVQVMKINETEPYLDRYYDFWEKQQVPIILQKQNTYLGRIEDRRYSDLTPFDRTPCWHLQRDMYVLYDGTVAFCKQDVDGKNQAGKLRDQSLKDIWEKSSISFENDYRGDLAASPDCSSCDEWYTFNF